MLHSSSTGYLEKKFGLVKAVEMLIEAGYPAIDISMFNETYEAVGDNYLEVAKKVREITDKAGVRCIQAHAPFGGGYEKYTTTLLPLMPRAFEFCSIVGIKNIVVHPIQKGRYYGREKELFELNVNFYRELAPIAKKFGVKIAIENMWQRHPVNKNIVDDVLAPPEELAAMYDALGDPETFTVCLDLGHVGLCEREPEDAVRIIGSRIGCIHAHDVDYRDDLHTLPGVGRLNWKNICEALAEVGFNGSFNLEADNFIVGFLDSQLTTALKFMSDIAGSMASEIEALKAGN